MTKPAGYKYGSWMVLHGSGAHLVGFSTACWLTYSDTDTIGLWSRCHHSQCTHLTASDLPDWLVSARVLACVSVVLIVTWLLVACQCRCLRARQARHKWMTRLEEILAISSGCCAFVSVGVFAVASASDSTLQQFSLSWSLWLVVGGVSASTLGGFIIAITRFPDPAIPKPNTRTIGPSGSVPRTGLNPGSAAAPQAGDQRRHHDVMDIFNVSAEAASQRGRNSPFCRTDLGQPPPPYSLTLARGHTSQSGGESQVFHASQILTRGPPNQSGGELQLFHTSQVVDVSRSPPPPYQSVLHELPPPYYVHVTQRDPQPPQDDCDWIL